MSASAATKTVAATAVPSSTTTAATTTAATTTAATTTAATTTAATTTATETSEFQNTDLNTLLAKSRKAQDIRIYVVPYFLKIYEKLFEELDKINKRQKVYGPSEKKAKQKAFAEAKQKAAEEAEKKKKEDEEGVLQTDYANLWLLDVDTNTTPLKYTELKEWLTKMDTELENTKISISNDVSDDVKAIIEKWHLDVIKPLDEAIKTYNGKLTAYEGLKAEYDELFTSNYDKTTYDTAKSELDTAIKELQDSAKEQKSRLNYLRENLLNKTLTPIQKLAWMGKFASVAVAMQKNIDDANDIKKTEDGKSDETYLKSIQELENEKNSTEYKKTVDDYNTAQNTYYTEKTDYNTKIGDIRYAINYDFYSLYDATYYDPNVTITDYKNKYDQAETEYIKNLDTIDTILNRIINKLNDAAISLKSKAKDLIDATNNLKLKATKVVEAADNGNIKKNPYPYKTQIEEYDKQIKEYVKQIDKLDIKPSSILENAKQFKFQQDEIHLKTQFDKIIKLLKSYQTFTKDALLLNISRKDHIDYKSNRQKFDDLYKKLDLFGTSYQNVKKEMQNVQDDIYANTNKTGINISIIGQRIGYSKSLLTNIEDLYKSSGKEYHFISRHFQFKKGGMTTGGGSDDDEAEIREMIDFVRRIIVDLNMYSNPEYLDSLYHASRLLGLNIFENFSISDFVPEQTNNAASTSSIGTKVFMDAYKIGKNKDDDTLDEYETRTHTESYGIDSVKRADNLFNYVFNAKRPFKQKYIHLPIISEDFGLTRDPLNPNVLLLKSTGSKASVPSVPNTAIPAKTGIDECEDSAEELKEVDDGIEQIFKNDNTTTSLTNTQIKKIITSICAKFVNSEKNQSKSKFIKLLKNKKDLIDGVINLLNSPNLKFIKSYVREEEKESDKDNERLKSGLVKLALDIGIVENDLLSATGTTPVATTVPATAAATTGPAPVVSATATVVGTGASVATGTTATGPALGSTATGPASGATTAAPGATTTAAAPGTPGATGTPGSTTTPSKKTLSDFKEISELKKIIIAKIKSTIPITGGSSQQKKYRYLEDSILSRHFEDCVDESVESCKVHLCIFSIDRSCSITKDEQYPFLKFIVRNGIQDPSTYEFVSFQYEDIPDDSTEDFKCKLYEKLLTELDLSLSSESFECVSASEILDSVYKGIKSEEIEGKHHVFAFFDFDAILDHSKTPEIVAKGGDSDKRPDYIEEKQGDLDEKVGTDKTGSLDQVGTENTGSLDQVGTENTGSLDQVGTDKTGSLDQVGTDKTGSLVRGQDFPSQLSDDNLSTPYRWAVIDELLFERNMYGVYKIDPVIPAVFVRNEILWNIFDDMNHWIDFPFSVYSTTIKESEDGTEKFDNIHVPIDVESAALREESIVLPPEIDVYGQEDEYGQRFCFTYEPFTYEPFNYEPLERKEEQAPLPKRYAVFTSNPEYLVSYADFQVFDNQPAAATGGALEEEEDGKTDTDDQSTEDVDKSLIKKLETPVIYFIANNEYTDSKPVVMWGIKHTNRFVAL